MNGVTQREKGAAVCHSRRFACVFSKDKLNYGIGGKGGVWLMSLNYVIQNTKHISGEKTFRKSYNQRALIV